MIDDQFEYGGEMLDVKRYKDGRFDCPFCKVPVVIDDESALTQHISLKHGKSAKVQKKCKRDGCDETWKDYKSGTEYCSVSCMATDTQADRLVKDCPQCGEEFTTPPSKDSKFCGKECYDDWQRVVEREVIVCNYDGCDEVLEARVDDKGRKFCSHECSLNDKHNK